MKIEKVFFDMDGVLADFERGVKELCGLASQSPNAKHRSPREDDQMWASIKEVPHFYDRLAPMPGAKELFDTVYGRYGDKCEILTAIPKPKRGIVSAAEDKQAWVHRVLGEDVKVNIVLREEKLRFCTGAACVLIDDMARNINDWKALGGTGIVYLDANETRKQLKAYGIC